MPLADIATLHLGRPVIVFDDERRENEGDIIMAAEHATSDGSHGSSAWRVDLFVPP